MLSTGGPRKGIVNMVKKCTPIVMEIRGASFTFFPQNGMNTSLKRKVEKPDNLIYQLSLGH